MSHNSRLSSTPKKGLLRSARDEKTVMWFRRVCQADGNHFISALINPIRSKALWHLDSVL